MSKEGIYTYFIDNQKTFGHRFLVFGIQEYLSTEAMKLCVNSSLSNPPIQKEKMNFTWNYEYRLYSSGCYYLDENNNWQSDDLLVMS